MQIDRRTTIAGLCAGLAMPSGAESPGGLRVTLLGQSLLEHDLRQQSWPGGAEIRAVLADADVVFSNLETVIARPGTQLGAPTRALETLHSGGPDVLECLRDLNVSLLATANNHAYDFGTAGVLSTLIELDAAGLPSRLRRRFDTHVLTFSGVWAVVAPPMHPTRQRDRLARAGDAAYLLESLERCRTAVDWEQNTLIHDVSRQIKRK